MNDPDLSPAPLMRRRVQQADSRVSPLELFFDLVFVFAVTQLSHGLLAHLDPLGAVQTLILLMAVWWVWMYTVWFTNWLNPETGPVRLTLILLMLVGLGLASAIPGAFSDWGPLFAGCYVLMQVGRTAFGLWAVWRSYQRANFIRILSWVCLSAALWLVGGAAHDGARLGWWLLALALDYLPPLAGYYTPGLGASSTHDWNISGEHMAERAGLFIIIALGESVLVMGATFAELPPTSVTVAALLAAFVGSVAMWWLYFVASAEAATRVISESSDPGRIARAAYTYGHVPIVAGIVLTAVGDELLLARPLGHVGAAMLLTAMGGPLVFLGGTLLFKRVVKGGVPLPHIAGLMALGGLALTAAWLSPLSLALLAALVLMGTGLWESRVTTATLKRPQEQ